MRAIRHFNEDAVRGFAPSYPDLCAALAQAFAKRAAGRASITPKVALDGVDQGFFHAMPAWYEGLAVVKWVASGSSPRGAYIHAVLMANDMVSGEVIASMDFGWATGLRTAAVSALAADMLAKPDASSLSVVGLGLQARMHLDALMSVRPITRMVALGRTPESIERYVSYAKARGLEVTASVAPDPGFYGSDIVLSCTPIRVAPFLDANRISPGSLLIAVDLAHPWHEDSLKNLDMLVTDDMEHYNGMLTHHDNILYALNVDHDLGSLVGKTGRVGNRTSNRIAFIPPGLALADAVLAGLVLRKSGIWS